MNQKLFKVQVIEDIKRKCIVQSFSPHTAHPSRPAFHPSQIMSLYYFITFGSSYPCHQGANQFTRTSVTLPCIHTELQHINFADLFSTGICFCTFHLYCTFMPGSCVKYPSAGGLAMSTCLVRFHFTSGLYILIVSFVTKFV